MNRMLKVFASGAEQDAASETLDVVERYPGFLIATAPSAQAKNLARKYLVEDITDLYEIPIADGVIDTSRPRIDTDGAVHPHPAYRGSRALPRGPHHYLVQFVGPIKDAWLRGVRRVGGQPRELYSNFAYVVRADDAALAKIAALPYVRWVGHLPHRARLAEPVAEKLRGGEPRTLPRTRYLPDAYTVEFFGADDAKAAVPAIRKLGVDVTHAEPKAKIIVVEVAGGSSERRRTLTALSAVHGVKQIRQRAVNRPSNDVAVGLMGTARAMGNPGLGLSGKNEIVAICDTGLDTGDATSIHPDFRGRIKSITSYPITPDFAQYVKNPGGNDGPADLDSGHGTHTSGSILGSGASSTGLAGLVGLVRGCAWNASLVFQAVEQEMDWKNPSFFQQYGRYLLAGIPADLTVLFGEAYRKGARVHSNSWGGGDPGAYDEQCEALDRFVWEHKDFCVLVASGNDGTDNDGDGKINPTSVSSPGTAKNCITVGACENRRPSFNSEMYGEWWPRDFPVAPFRSDPLADDPDEVVPFSSRGPTKDNRFKPEVVAPGTFVLSTRSTMIAQNNTAWAPFPPSKLYFFMGGTSMATPLTAGAVALVREYLRRKRRIAKPSAALLKASLVAGATRLPGTGTGSSLVDNDQGYGRVNLDGVLEPRGAAASFSDIRPGLRTGEIYSRSVAVKGSTRPLRIVVAYSDAPGPTLVNNLNLIVTGPDGKRYVGNQARAGAGTLDASNNVELVHVPRPGTGSWQIQVVGSNVPNGPQEFALVTIART
jgi:serine protease AprX